MHKLLWLSIVMAAIGAALLAAAATASGAAKASPQSASSAKARKGGTFRVVYSTADIEYTDPSLEYESPGWQIEYATALKLLNWKETKAQLYPEAAASFPRVGGGGR